MPDPFNVTNVPAAKIGDEVRNAFTMSNATRVIVVPDGSGTFTVKVRFDGAGND
jgi:hypothetical protein